MLAAIGEHEDLLAIKLDVTRPDDAQDAVEAAIGKFGRIDVLVNNAGNFYAGFFEELSPDQVRSQIETLLFGLMNGIRQPQPHGASHTSHEPSGPEAQLAARQALHGHSQIVVSA